MATTASLQGLGPLGLTVRTRRCICLPMVARGRVSLALVVLRTGMRSQSGLLELSSGTAT